MQNTPNISSLENSLIADYLQETVKCCDPEDGFIYFANKFAKCIHIQNGLTDVTLYGFQEDYLKHIHGSKYSVNVMARQTGKTLCAAIYIAWRLLFLSNQMIVVTSSKNRMAQELLERVKFILEHCPVWLKPSFSVANKGTLTLNNGSSVITSTLDIGSFRGRSRSIDFLYCDEVAFVDSRKVNELLHAVIPTMTQKGNIALTSTPKTDNDAFAALWKIANEADSTFKGFKATWRDHPEWDDKWKNYYSQLMPVEQFKKEYECIF